MTLSADNQQAFDEALAASKEEINSFYKADHTTSYSWGTSISLK